MNWPQLLKVKHTFLLFLFFSTINQAQVNHGLLAHFSFNDGHATDASGTLSGIMTNTLLSADRFGNIGQAIDFQNGDARIILGDIFDHFSMRDSSFSFSFWIQSRAANNEVIISKYGNSDCTPYEDQREFFIKVNPFRKIEMVYYSDLEGEHYRGVEGDLPISDNCWHHVVVNYLGHLDSNNGLDRVQIYIDNKRTTELFSFNVLGTLGNINNSTSNLGIGMSVDSEGAACAHDYKGQLDDIRIYRRALLPEEVALLYFETNPSNGLLNPLQADFSLEKDTLCLGETFTLRGQGPDCIHNWYWNLKGANIEKANAPILHNVAYNRSGTYEIQLIATNGFSSDTINKSIFVKHGLMPFLDTGHDTIICQQQAFSLDASIQNASFLWSTNETTPIIDIETEGWYSVAIQLDGCTIRDSMYIEYAELSKTLSDSIFLCEGDPLLLNVAHPTATSYLWQDGSTHPIKQVFDSGTYHVAITNACETLYDSVEVIINDAIPSVQLGRNQNLCEPDRLLLDATTPDGLHYTWQDGTHSSEHWIDHPGIYAVTVSNACGEASDEIVISGEDCCQLYVPNAFSPNGDGNNDLFQVYKADLGCEEFNRFSMSIFNRWGVQVFFTEHLTEGWDGTFGHQPANCGVYLYVLTYNDGYKDYQKTGDLTILR